VAVWLENRKSLLAAPGRGTVPWQINEYLNLKLKIKGRWGRRAPASGDFWKFVTKILHFKHISAKIWPKNLKLVHYLFLAIRGNIRLGSRDPWPSPWLRPCHQNTKFIKRHEIDQNYKNKNSDIDFGVFRLMMAPKGAEIDIAIFIFIILTDFVSIIKHLVLVTRYFCFNPIQIFQKILHQGT